MLRYYDKRHKRLVYFGKGTSPEFWDSHWSIDNFSARVAGRKNSTFILKNTQRFLKNGRILEGGCGMGGNVYCLHHNGYTAFGVDFAERTVRKINEYFPELNVTVGDVRSLEFKDGFFDGYWSLGVIEHFYEGYEAILEEMKRVVKNSGYVFLAFPYMSLLRRFKAKLALYKKYENNTDLNDFYQFALDAIAIQNNFERNGFILKYSNPFDGLKGLKDEVLIFKPILQKLYDYNGGSSLVYRLRSLLSSLLANLSGHMILIIFQQKGEERIESTI